MSLNTEVAVVGGGIGGLTLGLKLARSKIDVMVIEKLEEPSSIYKGELLQPKSLQIFEKLDVLKDIQCNGFSFSRIAFEEGKNEFFMDYRILPGDYDYAVMIEHEKLKRILLSQALQYPNFQYLSGAFGKGYCDGRLIVERKNRKERLFVKADFYVGAEGRNSITRKEMNSKIKKIDYNHHFLTVTFPRPQSLDEGKIISKDERFLGLFPLPKAKVRSVYLIPKGSYKEFHAKGIDHFHQNYLELFPELKGYVTRLKDWSDIQLMIPTAFYADKYVNGRYAILGDAAHTVHPMAGEGMNMAIQDADILGELYESMYSTGRISPGRLKWYEKVRKPRAEKMISLSHLSALVYSYSNRFITGIRRKGLKQMERDKTLQFKQMLNVSGLGYWSESALDRFVQAGMLPARNRGLSSKAKRNYFYTEKDDYPWKS
ncbi:FAD-dependent monooxygenase [Bacillus sp. ISL-47]|uniref:FAD-dependent oxidoreductase n=1 Tax=Bacillus sp. ISL-47 TaxID=2819130 RepID=UPI001BE63B9D|nr:NAD(P)/FAD-dependent oxidoreductase [Bacillus sp. ISL-47]MBT2688469.1 FAD-dependent monooxygenase [Bacillus sp. ISL-47]MBT2709068.1 FAD-dependent monooxygenase [Pseudomonas sp. ISL-84]